MDGGETGTDVTGGHGASPKNREIANRISMATNHYNSNLYQESLAPLIFLWI